MLGSWSLAGFGASSARMGGKTVDEEPTGAGGGEGREEYASVWGA